MKRFLLSLVVCIFCFVGLANETEWQIDGEIVVYSKHHWRGMGFGNTPSFEPSVTFSKGIFSLNLWGAQTTDNSYVEVDVIPSLNIGKYQFIIFDYYNPVNGGHNDFFTFKEGENRHSAEFAIVRNPSKYFPVKLMGTSFFFGDKNAETGNPFYSTYLEAAYSLDLKWVKLEPTLGIATHKSYYAEGFAVINSSFSIKKEIELAHGLTMPLSLSMIHNPDQNKSFLSFGSGISF